MSFITIKIKRTSVLFYSFTSIISILNFLFFFTSHSKGYLINILVVIFIMIFFFIYCYKKVDYDKRDVINDVVDPKIDQQSDILEISDLIKNDYAEINKSLLNSFNLIIDKKCAILKNKILNTIESSKSKDTLIKRIKEISKDTEDGNNGLKVIIKNIASGIDADMKQSRSNITRINQLFDKIKTSKENTELLKKNSEFLLIIMNTIEEISIKIHVLSINSSITAARAGDVGKPFMVIAKEIRGLSESVKKSVEEMKNYSSILKNSINIVSDLNETVDKETRMTYQGFNSLLNRIEGFLLSFSVIEGRITGSVFPEDELINIIKEKEIKFDLDHISKVIIDLKDEINKTTDCILSS